MIRCEKFGGRFSPFISFLGPRHVGAAEELDVAKNIVMGFATNCEINVNVQPNNLFL